MEHPCKNCLDLHSLLYLHGKEGTAINENTYKILFVALIFAFLLPIGYFIAKNEESDKYPENPDYRNHLVGLNLESLEPGSYNYSVLVENPYENLSIRIYSFLFSDPEAYKNYVGLTWSIENGTLLTPSETVQTVFYVEVEENFYEDGELYLRVGCWRVGEDY